MKSKLILVILLVGILIFSFVQAFEINTIKENGISPAGTSYGTSSSSSSSYSSPAQAAPTMVGGC